MRGIKIKNIRLTLGFMAIMAFVSTSMAQPIELITLTNTTWSTEQNANLDGTAWNEFDYNDSTWRTGLGAWSFGDAGNAFIQPFINSINESHLVAAGTNAVPRALYYRTHFNYSGNAASAIFTFTNLVDDGVVVYLNGVRIYDLRVTDNPATYSTLATGTHPPNGEADNFEVVQFLGSALTSLLDGDNVLAVVLYQNSATSSDSGFALALNVEEGAGMAPSFTSPTADQGLTVVQGQSQALTVAVDGNPTPTIQWEFSSDDGATFNAITNNGTSATYTIASMTTNEVGLYRAVAMNALDSATSPIFNIMIQEDGTPPTLVTACSEDGGRNIRVQFSENIKINGDLILYLVVGDDNSIFGVTNVFVENGVSDTLLMWGLRDAFGSGALTNFQDGVSYQLLFYDGATPSVSDLFDNGLENNVTTNPLGDFPAFMQDISPSLNFRQGVNGYAGVRDTEIRGDIPGQDGSELTVLNPDGADNGFPVNGLVRFTGIFGSAPGQIPFGSAIISARLVLTTTAGGVGDPTGVYRMLEDWDDRVSWNTFGQTDGTPGLQPGSEAVSTATGIVDPSNGTAEEVDVTADLQSWSDNPGSNLGWALIPEAGSTDGWDLNSSEATTEGDRPYLVVCFAPVACTDPPSIPVGGDPVGFTINEGASASLDVTTECGQSYQWYKNNVAIPGETSFDLNFDSAVPADSGDYYVVVSNDQGMVESAVATVVVNADEDAPVLLSSSTDGDAGTVTLRFDEALAMAAAQNVDNYVITITSGGSGQLTVNSAELQANGTDVVLSIASPTLDQRYSMTVSGLTDLAVAVNMIDPIAIDPLIFGYVVIDWTDLTWSYTTNGLVDAPVPGWEAPGFDDSAWETGQALFGLETSSGPMAVFPPDGILTPWPVGEGATFITAFYLRTTANIDFAPAADVSFAFRHLIDDGAVFYVGGTEAARVRVSAPAPVLYTDIADSATDYGIEEVASSVPFVMGDNALAVEVHQGSATSSSDILFGTQILAYGGFVGESSLSIEQVGSDVIVSWSGPGPLLSAPTPAGPWTAVTGATSPYTVPAPLADMLYFGLGAP